ncbi:MAG: PLP-dependent aminotransferase family protein [Veillonellaceae bacterium]|nr:PLP-dependent aminotransferase family protein [Veillonellaceae bacterium]
MLTYDLSTADGPLYVSLAKCIRDDITAGRLHRSEHLPSKRSLARNLGISTITVQNAYDQLVSEGYVTAKERRGYFVADIGVLPNAMPHTSDPIHSLYTSDEDEAVFDFSSDRADTAFFPFSIWARLTREMLTNHKEEMLTVPPSAGVYSLRSAIAEHLSSFRGMKADPAQIIVGAGTEYLYGLLIQLLGRKRIYCIENPGYRKLIEIYQHQGVHCALADIDKDGIRVDALEEADAEVAHICPNHHFPTGITMPVSRRYELLAWVNRIDGRYIIEDDYDSEFRMKGRPLPTLQSIDAAGRVIYMNTFSKSLASTIRISYMVLPVDLASRFAAELSFYSCTVPVLEQYTLAAFIRRGFFERHINRMRRHYARLRDKILLAICEAFPYGECSVIENGSGLHFLLKAHTDVPDDMVQERLLREGIRIQSIGDFCMDGKEHVQHMFLVNYSCMDIQRLPKSLRALGRAIQETGNDSAKDLAWQ